MCKKVQGSKESIDELSDWQEDQMANEKTKLE